MAKIIVDVMMRYFETELSVRLTYPIIKYLMSTSC